MERSYETLQARAQSLVRQAGDLLGRPDARVHLYQFYRATTGMDAEGERYVGIVQSSADLCHPGYGSDSADGDIGHQTSRSLEIRRLSSNPEEPLLVMDTHRFGEGHGMRVRMRVQDDFTWEVLSSIRRGNSRDGTLALGGLMEAIILHGRSGDGRLDHLALQRHASELDGALAGILSQGAAITQTTYHGPAVDRIPGIIIDATELIGRKEHVPDFFTRAPRVRLMAPQSDYIDHDVVLCQGPEGGIRTFLEGKSEPVGRVVAPVYSRRRAIGYSAARDSCVVEHRLSLPLTRHHIAIDGLAERCSRQAAGPIAPFQLEVIENAMNRAYGAEAA